MDLQGILSIVAMVVALGGGFGFLLRLRVERGKLRGEAAKADADAVHVLAGAAAQLVSPLRQELKLAEARAAELYTQLAEVTQELRRVRSQLEQMSRDLTEVRDISRVEKYDLKVKINALELELQRLRSGLPPEGVVNGK